MITIWLLMAIATKQRANGLNSLVLSFPCLSMTSQLMKWLIPVIAIWLLMAIPSKMGLAAQFHWFKRSTLVNINDGHSEGYIRNARLGSVPKIANLLHLIYLSIITSDPSGQSFFSRLFASKPAGWYVLHYWLLFRFGS